MYYIVFRNKFKNSYGVESNGGYFVGWKNKIEDKYSSNIILAKKYTSLKSAMNRLFHTSKFLSLDKFLENNLYKSDIRDRKLNNLFDIYEENIFSFENGGIYKIDEYGNLIGDTNKEIIDFIKAEIKKRETKIKKLHKITGESNYISKENFWL